MKRRGVYSSLNTYIRGKYGKGDKARMFRIRFQQDSAFNAVETDQQQSPGAWSVTAAILAGALKYLVNGDDSEKARKMIGASADRAARCMVKALEKCRDGCKVYKGNGFQLPKEIGERVRKCAAVFREYEAWKKAKSKNGE